MSEKECSYEWPYENQEEYALYCSCLEYEEQYFEDMTLQEGSPLYSLIETEPGYVRIDINGNHLKVRLVENSDFYGCHYNEERKIEINVNYANDKNIILHEMIHFYEYLLTENRRPYFREMLVLELYKKLSAKIPNLWECLLEHYNSYEYVTTLAGCGEHGVLFYLKSLDLDIRYGFPLGTVCGYGRNEMDVSNLTHGLDKEKGSLEVKNKT